MGETSVNTQQHELEPVEGKPVTISLQQCINQLVFSHCGRIGFNIQYGGKTTSPISKKSELKKKLYNALFIREHSNRNLSLEWKLVSWFMPDIPLAWCALHFHMKFHQNYNQDLQRLDLLVKKVLAYENSCYDSILSVLMLLSKPKSSSHSMNRTEYAKPVDRYATKRKVPSIIGPSSHISNEFIFDMGYDRMTKSSNKNEPFYFGMREDEIALLNRLASSDSLSPGDVYNLPMLFPTQELDLMQFLHNKFHKSSTDEGCYTARSETENAGKLTPVEDYRPLAIQLRDDQPYMGYKKPTYDVKVWEDASKTEVNKYYSWEAIDRSAPSRKLLYLTEAGATVYDAVWQYRCRIIRELAAHLRKHNAMSNESMLMQPTYHTTDEATLLYHSRLVCFGIASETFHFNKIANMFLPKKQIHLPGVTTSSLRVLLKHFAQWGTAYWRLLHFSLLASKVTSRYFNDENQRQTSSVIFKAFCEGIRCYLHEYQRFLLYHESGVETLLQRYFKFRRLGTQLCYMCGLCQCGDPSDSHVMSLDNFPSGVSILSYVYEEALFCIGSSHHFVLLYLLRKCCLPYLKFVQNWVFHGACWDVSGDFMIQVNHDNASRKDRQRWSNYISPLSSTEQKLTVPSFLLPICEALFLCGKTIELLHNIAPGHFLCSHSLDIPNLIVTFSKSRIEANGSQWYNLQCEMRELELKRSFSWLENEEKKKQLEQASFAAAIQAHDQLVQEKLEEDQNILIQTRKLKQVELGRLKQQAEEEAKKKQAEKLKKIREEKLKADEKQGKAEKALHQKAKDELISHYHLLYDEADKRKRIAEWKIRRFALSEKRRKFFQSEKIYFAGKDTLNASQLVEMQLQRSADPTSSTITTTQSGERASTSLDITSSPRKDGSKRSVENVEIAAQTALKNISEIGGEINPMRRKQVSGFHVSDWHDPAAKTDNTSSISPSTAPGESISEEETSSKGVKTTQAAAKNISEIGGEINPMRRKQVSGFHVSDWHDPAAKTDNTSSISPSTAPGESISEEDTSSKGVKTTQAAAKNISEIGGEINPMRRKQVSGFHVSDWHDPVAKTDNTSSISPSTAPGESISEEDTSSKGVKTTQAAAKNISEIGGEINPMRRKQVSGFHVSDWHDPAAKTDNTSSISPSTAPGESISEEDTSSKGVKTTQAAAKNISEIGGEINPMRRKQVSGFHVSDWHDPVAKTDNTSSISPSTTPGESISEEETSSKGVKTTQAAAKNISEIGGEINPMRRKQVSGFHVSDWHDPAAKTDNISSPSTAPGKSISEEDTSSKELGSQAISKSISELGGEINPMRRKQVSGFHVSDWHDPATKTDNTSSTSPSTAPGKSISEEDTSSKGEKTTQAATKNISELGEEVNPMRRKQVAGHHVSQSAISFQTELTDDAQHKQLQPHLPEPLDNISEETAEKSNQYQPTLQESTEIVDPVKLLRKPVEHSHVSQSSLRDILNEGYKIGDSEVVKPAVHKPPAHQDVKRNVSDSTIQHIMYKQTATVKTSSDGHDVTDDLSMRNESENDQQGVATVKRDVDQSVDTHSYSLQLPQSGTYDDFTEQISKRLNLPDRKTRTELLRSVNLLSFHHPNDELIDEDTLDLSDEGGAAVIDLHVLPNLLGSCIMQPIKWHARLVNRCAVNYFMMNLSLPRHFKTLRRYLLLEDGEFGSALSRKLFDLGHSGRNPAEVFNPLNLDSIMEHSLQATRRNTVTTCNLSLAVKYLPQVFSTTNLQVLDCLELCYHVEWPCNIIITQGSHDKYNQVLSFLLHLNYVSWALHDIRSQLNSLATHKRVTKMKQSEIQELQIYRHEMLNFVKVMQGYVSTQVLHVCWKEFWDDLRNNVNDLEDLHQRHAEYLNKCIMRCLLTKKAQNVMNVIVDVLKSILRFHTQLSALVPLPLLYKTYKEFTRLSNFLYKVVSKLVGRGYQPHLEDFLTRLNFNGFYKD